MHWGRIKVTWYKLLLYRGGHYSRFDDDALYFEIGDVMVQIKIKLFVLEDSGKTHCYNIIQIGV
jgi:hypothetical protein